MPLGAYRIAARSVAVTATLAANSDLFSFQFPKTEVHTPSIVPYVCIIQSFRVSARVSAAITTAVPFDLALYIARSYSVPDTGGSIMNKVSMAPYMRPSLIKSVPAASSSILVTSGSGLSVGTYSLDTYPLGRVQGNSGTAVGTEFFANPNPQKLLIRQNSDHYPIVLNGNEGLILQNPLIGPATGTFQLYIQMTWIETPAF